jgi:hypothetical protein
VPGTDKGFNQELEKAARVADFLNWRLLAMHTHRNESCGGHFVKNNKPQMEKQRVTMKILLT